MIDKNCFPTYDGKCVAYSGALFPDTVKYKLDDSVDDAIEKLTAYVLSVRKVESSVNLDSYGTSICSGKLKDVSFEYQIEAKSNSAEISFNYTNTTKELPSGFNVVRSGLELITKTNNIVNLNGELGGASLSPVDFPVNAKFYINVSSPCGLIVLSKPVRLPLSDVKLQTDFTIQDFGEDVSQTFKTSQQALSFLNEKMASLDKKIDNRTKIQNGSISDYIYNIANDLSANKNSLSSVESKIQNSRIDDIPNLSDQVQTLSNQVQALTAQNKTLTSKIEVLENG